MPNEGAGSGYAWFSDDTVMVVRQKDGSFTATPIESIGDINSTEKVQVQDTTAVKRTLV